MQWLVPAAAGNRRPYPTDCASLISAARSLLRWRHLAAASLMEVVVMATAAVVVDPVFCVL